MPEKMREAFSIGGMEEEDGEGYLSSLLLDGVTTSPFTSKGREVSWGYLGFTANSFTPELPFLCV